MKLGTRITALVSTFALALTGGAITATAAQATNAEPDPGTPPDDGKCYDWVPPTTTVEDQIKKWVIDEPAVDEETLYEWSPESPGDGWTKTGKSKVLVEEAYDWFVLGAGYDKDTPPLPNDPNWVDPRGEPKGQPHLDGRANPNVPYQVDNPGSQGKDWFLWTYTAPEITYKWVKVIPGSPEEGHWKYRWIAEDESTPPGWQRTGETRTVEGEPGYWKEKPCEPPPETVDVCKNLKGDQESVPEGWTESNGECFYKTYVCWEIDNPVENYPSGLPVFPQTFQYQGDSFDEAYEYCKNIEVECEDVRQFQVDRYDIDSYKDEALLAGLIENGLWGGHRGEGGDGKIYDGKHKFIQLVGEECAPPPPVTVDICYWNGESAVSKEILESDLKQDDILWEDSNGGLGCTPTVDLCIDWEKVENVPVTDPRADQYDEWNSEDCLPPPPPPVECENLLGPDGAEPFMPEGIEIQKWSNGDCYYEVYVCWEMVNPVIDFPSALPTFPQTYVGHSATQPQTIADCGEVVPECEEVIQIQWDKYRIRNWAQANRLDEIIENGLNKGTYAYDRPDDSIIVLESQWGFFQVVGDECPPPPNPPAPEPYCELVEGVGTQVFYDPGEEPEGSIEWMDGSECEPNLDGTVVGHLCQGDVPYFTYDIVLNDPLGSVANPNAATLTWVNPFGDDLVMNLTQLSGQELWPGASTSPLGWPGWEYNETTEEYEEVGNDNFGWTRTGVDVIISINPEMTVTAVYPAATEDCADPDDEEDDEFGGVLSAGPAVPVRGVATYAG